MAEVDVQYPVTVVYCGICGYPPEYCEFGSADTYAKCKVWIVENAPEVLPGLKKEDVAQDAKLATQEKVQMLPGGKVKKTELPSVIISHVARTKRKWVTIVTGISGFGIDPNQACKIFRNKFACGASVSRDKKDEIVIQGDVKDEIFQVMMGAYKDKIKPADVFYLQEDGSKVCAAS